MKQAEKLARMFTAAKAGGFALTKLNWVLWMVIPFNKRHGFKVKEIGDDFVKTWSPYKRKNFNHIKGIHACGIATISEFATGLLLLTRVDPSKYRIIMSELRMEYHYQAKMALTAECKLTDEEIQNEIITPLKTQDAIKRTMIAMVTDEDGNHVATGHITWQIKGWEKVRTKL